jgi:hypothetical protein
MVQVGLEHFLCAKRPLYHEADLQNFFLYLFSDLRVLQHRNNFITEERKSTGKQRRFATQRLISGPAVQYRLIITIILYGQTAQVRVITGSISIGMNGLLIN